MDSGRVEVLAPRLNETETGATGEWWETKLQAMQRAALGVPFAPESIEFVHCLSQAILLDPAMRQYPELLAMAHWLRKANMLAFAEQHRFERLRLARGIVLHFAPSNVDSIFIYSWMISLLMGNANIVRLSQRRGAQVEVLIRLIADLLAAPEHRAIRERSMLVSYGHDDRVTELLSGVCHMRVIWGGDETVRRIRSITLNPLAAEIAFADRFSLVALDAQSVVAETDAGLERLAQQFYNDAFWFDQMACSSPRLLVWLGDGQYVAPAQERFWPAVEKVIALKGYSTAAAVGMRRLTMAYHFASRSDGSQLPGESAATPTRVVLPTLLPELREQHCGGGLFAEVHCETLEQLTPHLTQKDQTLSVYGVARERLAEWVLQLPHRSIDRIVPVGQALSFAPVWDGQDLFMAFTREVSLG